MWRVLLVFLMGLSACATTGGRRVAPERCAPCEIGEGYCEGSKVRMVCIVPKPKECPNSIPNAFVMLPVRDGQVCRCAWPEGRGAIECD